MTTLTAPEDPRALAATAPGAPRLRLRRAGRAEQTYPLEPGKWTIGSSPRCHVRLPAAEAQPLQCLITLEQGAAIVTRWATGVLLNGREFSKKPLQSGDRLSIGPWEIEWEEGDEAAKAQPGERPPEQASTPMPATAPPSPPALERQFTSSTNANSDPSPAVAAAEPASAVETAAIPAAATEASPEFAPESPIATATPATSPEVAESRIIAAATSPVPFTAHAPSPLHRPAAKTVLVASRKTDPFDQPLGPMAPPTLVKAEAAPRLAHASAAFQDRLVVELWSASFAARSRTKALVAGARTTRERANQLADMTAEFENRLQEVSALSDAHEADHQAEREALDGELTQAFAECDRLVAELETFQTASEAQSAEIKSQHDALHEQLVQTVAERDRLITEQDAQVAASDVQAAERTANYDALQALLDEADAARGRLAGELQSLRTNADLQIAERQVQFDVVTSELSEASAARDRLMAQLSDLQKQFDAEASKRQSLIESLRRDGADAASERDRLIAELETLRTARPQTAPPDPRLQTLADANAAAEVEAARLREQVAASEQQIVALQQKISAEDAAHAVADEQLAAHGKAQLQWQSERDALVANLRRAEEEAACLRDELTACETHIERLEEQFSVAEAARAALDQQLADQQRQQAHWLAECQTLQTNHAAAIADVELERDELQQRLDELASQPAPAPVDWPAPVEAPLPNRPANSAFAPPQPPSPESETAAAQLNRTPEPVVEPAPAAEFSQPAWPAAEPEPIRPTAPESAAPAALEAVIPAAAPAPAFAPTSFIDKYRHLLDDDASTPEPSIRKSQPILDDEYLSPAQFDDTGHADNDSDEALEAYMSNMMRRVRSTGSNVVASMAPSNFGPQRSEEPVAPPAKIAEDAAAVEMELDANGMQRAVRKNPTIATNLAALRELANSSARPAIAQHRQRRHVESAIVKGAFFAVAAGASAYLMLTAPGVESPWFWGGCVAMVAAGGAAAQLITLFWKRLTDGRRYKYPTAPSTAPGALVHMPAVDGEQAEPAAP